MHPFFDHAPFPSVDKLEVSMVPLTFVGSDFGYELDLVSGEKYRRYPYCSQKDVWKELLIISIVLILPLGMYRECSIPWVSLKKLLSLARRDILKVRIATKNMLTEHESWEESFGKVVQDGYAIDKTLGFQECS